MAIVKDIFGKVASGKIGPVTTYPLRDKLIARSLPRKSSGPRTENQLRNQHRFQQIGAFCAPFKAVVIPQIWNSLATTSSGYHLFMKTNGPAFDLEGNLTDPMKIKLSMGKLSLPPGMQAQRTSTGGSTIQVQWEKDGPMAVQPENDRLMVISAGEGQYSEIKATGLIRKNLGGSFELPPLNEAASHVYLFFESIDQRYYSESACFEI